MVVTVKRNSKTLIAAIVLIEKKKNARVFLDSIAEEGFVVAFWVSK